MSLHLLRYFFPIHIILLFFSFYGLSQNRTPVKDDFYLVSNIQWNELNEIDKNLIDSCLSFYHETKVDTLKLIALETICENMIHQDWEKYQLILYDQIRSMIHKRNPNRSVALKIKKSLGLAFNNLSVIYRKKGEVNKALRYSLKGMRIRKELKDPKGFSESLANAAEIFIKKGQLATSIKFLHKTLRISNQVYDYDQIVSSLSHLGSIYIILKEKNKALQYLNKGLQICEESTTTNGKAELMCNLGVLYSSFGQPEIGITYYKNGLKFYHEMGDNYRVSILLFNLGKVYSRIDSCTLAQEYSLKALAIQKKYHYHVNYGGTLNILGKASLCLNRKHTAQLYFEEALRHSKKYKILNQITESAFMLSKIYEKQNRLTESLEMNRLYIESYKLVSRMDIREKVIEVENKITEEERNKTIALLKREKKSESVRFFNSLWIGGFILVFLIITGLWWFKVRNKHFQSQLNELRVLRTEKPSQKPSNFQVVQGKNLFSVKTEDIVFFKPEGGYVFLTTKDGKSFIVDQKLAELEESLPNNFFRVHRSYIINNGHILKIEKRNRGRVIITMKDPTQTKLQSSFSYKNEVEKVVKGFLPNNT